MWGSDKQFDLSNANGSQSQQVSRIDYGRPETWSFFMSFKCISASGPAATPGSVQCAFDLFVGAGRSTVQIRNFMVFTVSFIDASNAAVGPLLWATQTQSPQNTFPVSGAPTLPVDYIVAHSINCEARVLNTSVDPLVQIQCVASAFFAPRAHIRPEWFRGGTFKGGENDGT
jgi:hypothetical protein